MALFEIHWNGLFWSILYILFFNKNVFWTVQHSSNPIIIVKQFLYPHFLSYTEMVNNIRKWLKSFNLLQDFDQPDHQLLKPKYSWLSLSRTHLSRITAYLKVKILSLPKHENRTTSIKILWKRGEISPLFHNIFDIAPSQEISWSVSENPLEFTITRVDCIIHLDFYILISLHTYLMMVWCITSLSILFKSYRDQHTYLKDILVQEQNLLFQQYLMPCQAGSYCCFSRKEAV